MVKSEGGMQARCASGPRHHSAENRISVVEMVVLIGSLVAAPEVLIVKKQRPVTPGRLRFHVLDVARTHALSHGSQAAVIALNRLQRAGLRSDFGLHQLLPQSLP